MAAYRTELPGHRGRVTIDTPQLPTAIRRDQGFRLVYDQHDAWWVWIGPKDTPPTLEGGTLSPARGSR